MQTEQCDVLVIGGGPAGSTISALLSERGWRVTVLEMDEHPRFHIGESLLPRNMPLFERLGVMDQLKKIGIEKRAVDLSLPLSDQHVSLRFSEALDSAYPTAFQVRRSELDCMLLRNSAAKGATVLERTKATQVDLESTEGVEVKGMDENGQERIWMARFLVDASGRQTFLSDRLRLKERNRRHNTAAMFGHFHGVERRSKQEAGNISLYWFDHGWFWLIPLREGIVSVGAVVTPTYLRSREGSLEEFFFETIALSPPLAARMTHAELAYPITATGNYSYSSKGMFGDRYLLIGDAYAFIDPVFSTGVYLAMFSATMGADAVDQSLRDPARGRIYLKRHARRLERGMARFSWFIYRFTTPPMRRLFMAPSDRFNIKQAVISLLAGDAFNYTALRLPLALFKALYYFFSLVCLASRAQNSVRKWLVRSCSRQAVTER